MTALRKTCHVPKLSLRSFPKNLNLYTPFLLDSYDNGHNSEVQENVQQECFNMKNILFRELVECLETRI